MAKEMEAMREAVAREASPEVLEVAVMEAAETEAALPGQCDSCIPVAAR